MRRRKNQRNLTQKREYLTADSPRARRRPNRDSGRGETQHAGCVLRMLWLIFFGVLWISVAKILFVCPPPRCASCAYSRQFRSLPEKVAVMLTLGEKLCRCHAAPMELGTAHHSLVTAYSRNRKGRESRASRARSKARCMDSRFVRSTHVAGDAIAEGKLRE